MGDTETALVLAGGGVTGIAWELGVLDALVAAGVPVLGERPGRRDVGGRRRRGPDHERRLDGRVGRPAAHPGERVEGAGCRARPRPAGADVRADGRRGAPGRRAPRRASARWRSRRRRSARPSGSRSSRPGSRTTSGPRRGWCCRAIDATSGELRPLRPWLGRPARRRRGRELRGPRRVAAGHHRRPALHRRRHALAGQRRPRGRVRPGAGAVADGGTDDAGSRPGGRSARARTAPRSWSSGPTTRPPRRWDRTPSTPRTGRSPSRRDSDRGLRPPRRRDRCSRAPTDRRQGDEHRRRPAGRDRDRGCQRDRPGDGGAAAGPGPRGGRVRPGGRRPDRHHRPRRGRGAGRRRPIVARPRRRARQRGGHRGRRAPVRRGVPRHLGADARREPHRVDAPGSGVPRRPAGERARPHRQRGLDRGHRGQPRRGAVHRVQARRRRADPVARGRARPARPHHELRVPGCHAHRDDPRHPRGDARHLRPAQRADRALRPARGDRVHDRGPDGDRGVLRERRRRSRSTAG